MREGSVGRNSYDGRLHVVPLDELNRPEVALEAAPALLPRRPRHVAVGDHDEVVGELGEQELGILLEMGAPLLLVKLEQPRAVPLERRLLRERARGERGDRGRRRDGPHAPAQTAAHRRGALSAGSSMRSTVGDAAGACEVAAHTTPVAESMSK